jgi:hypothetical protein
MVKPAPIDPAFPLVKSRRLDTIAPYLRAQRGAVFGVALGAACTAAEIRIFRQWVWPLSRALVTRVSESRMVASLVDTFATDEFAGGSATGSVRTAQACAMQDIEDSTQEEAGDAEHRLEWRDANVLRAPPDARLRRHAVHAKDRSKTVFCRRLPPCHARERTAPFSIDIPHRHLLANQECPNPNQRKRN